MQGKKLFLDKEVLRSLTGLQRRFRANELPLCELLADAGYANGSNYALLEAAHITA